MRVDGRSCKTTPQLAQALYRFRAGDKPRLFWIQSLSINIHDVNERSGQVRRLREILLSAQGLIVWLGGAEDDSDLVFEHLGNFEHLRSKYDQPFTLPEGLDLGLREAHSGAPTASDRLQPYAGDSAHAFEKLC